MLEIISCLSSVKVLALNELFSGHIVNTGQWMRELIIYIHLSLKCVQSNQKKAARQNSGVELLNNKQLLH